MTVGCLPTGGPRTVPGDNVRVTWSVVDALIPRCEGSPGDLVNARLWRIPSTSAAGTSAVVRQRPMETCPLGTPWCTDHEPPDAPDNWAECVRIIGTVVLEHGPTTAAFRSDPDDGTAGEVIISVRQIEGDSPIVEVEWPDSTADFPGVETWTPREAREIGGYMVQAAGLLDGGL